MSQQELAKGAVEVMKRVEAENALKSAQEIVLDDSNQVSFPGYPYKFEAQYEKILVSVDIFKTGYECKGCEGKKHIEVKQGRESTFVECPICNGMGATLILPETSKNLPTTGVIVSMGWEAKEKLKYRVYPRWWYYLLPFMKRYAYHLNIGDRVLFGPYAGTMIPTKIGLMFKYMDWYLGVVKIEGADDMSAFDFILQVEQ